MQHPRISLLCALHNCLGYTKEMLASLERSTDLTDCEIVLVDDASSDETPVFLDSLEGHDSLRILRNPENQGFARSNNRAAEIARGEILVFINNDLVFSENWLPPLLSALETLPQVGAVGNVQRNAATGLVDHAGIFFDLEGMPTHAHKNRVNPPRGSWIERNAVTAACMAIRRETFETLGGFDESYRNGFEDVDLCMKLKQAGLRNYVCLTSVISHHISVSPGRNLNNERNTEIFRERWSRFAAPFGHEEWAGEYFRRYARYWWRMNPQLCVKALLMLAGLKKTKSYPQP